jgi:hypothetical protein
MSLGLTLIELCVLVYCCRIKSLCLPLTRSVSVATVSSAEVLGSVSVSLSLTMAVCVCVSLCVCVWLSVCVSLAVVQPV